MGRPGWSSPSPSLPPHGHQTKFLLSIIGYLRWKLCCFTRKLLSELNIINIYIYILNFHLKNYSFEKLVMARLRHRQIEICPWQTCPQNSREAQNQADHVTVKYVPVISQGSVATHSRRSKNFNDKFIANLLSSISWKNSENRLTFRELFLVLSLKLFIDLYGKFANWHNRL